jgi:hypothetical protein
LLLSPLGIIVKFRWSGQYGFESTNSPLPKCPAHIFQGRLCSLRIHLLDSDPSLSFFCLVLKTKFFSYLQFLSQNEKTKRRKLKSTGVLWRNGSLHPRQARRIYPPQQDDVEYLAKWGATHKLSHFVVYNLYDKFGKLQDGPQPRGEAGHLLAWIKRRAQNDHSVMMEEARRLSTEGSLQGIEKLVSEAPDVMEMKIAKLLHDNMSDILHERRTGVELLISEGLLTPFYETGILMTGVYLQLFNILSDIAHVGPNLRVLEIGGGTGGATRIAMKAFNGPNGIKSYKDYTLTDVSAGALFPLENVAHLRKGTRGTHPIRHD